MTIENTKTLMNGIELEHRLIVGGKDDIIIHMVTTIYQMSCYNRKH